MAMLRFHHVNLGVPGPQLAAEERFLLEVLGLERIEPPEELVGRARWFGFEDGTQIHLSEEDPGVVPSERGHVAVDLGDALPTVEGRARAAGLDVVDGRFGTVVFCTDPSGHRWELRG